jgi:glycosyltransferase involved in cell wall biosynthesis
LVYAVTPSKGWLPEILEEADIPAATIRMKGTGWLRTMGFLINQVRRQKIDVVHTHLTRAAYIGHALGIVTRTPIVTSVHIANNDQIYRRLARGRNRLVAVSNFVAGMLHGNGIPKPFIETVYNGTDFIDLPRSDRNEVLAELGIPTEKKVVGLVAKLCHDKGQMQLIHAMGEVRKAHPDAHVLFVGKVEESFRTELEDAVRTSGFEQEMTFTGVRHDIARLLDAMTLSTLPSVMETFGVAAIEASARGKAVVATEVGALPEVVKHKQTGLLVDLRPEAIAEAISYLLTNDREREEMGRRGRDLVAEKFSLTEMVTRFEAVYRSAAR